MVLVSFLPYTVSEWLVGELLRLHFCTVLEYGNKTTGTVVDDLGAWAYGVAYDVRRTCMHTMHEARFVVEIWEL